MAEGSPDIGVGKLPEQREFKGYSFLTEILIPLAQAGLAGIAKAGRMGIKWLWPVPIVGVVFMLALDSARAPRSWVWASALFPIVVWMIAGGIIALNEFFDLVYGRMSVEARHWTADRPGESLVTEIIRYRIVFVNGRKAEVEDLTPPVEDAIETVIDSHVQDLAEFVALAESVGLSKSSWCPSGESRITLPSGQPVSQPRWAVFMEELATQYRFVRKEGGAYVWAVQDPKEAVAFLRALAEGNTKQLPPYPTSVSRLYGGR